jgi:hypothetical protein
MMPAMKSLRSPRGERPAFSPILDSKRLVEHDFKEFLLQERGLALGSADRYLEVARRFLSFRCSMRQKPWQRLDAKGVIDFVLHDSSDRGRRSAQLMTAALRCLLRFDVFRCAKRPSACCVIGYENAMARLGKFYSPMLAVNH